MAIISNLHDNPAHRYCLCFIAEETETYGVKPVVQGHKTSRRQTQDLSLDLNGTDALSFIPCRRLWNNTLCC